MKNKNFIFKIALGLIVIGLIFIVLGKLMGGKSIIVKNGLEHIAYDNNVNRVIEDSDLQEFKNIAIDANLDKIEIIKSNSNRIELNYKEKAGIIDYKIDNDTLIVTQSSNKTIGFDINISSNKEQDILKIYVNNSLDINKATINQDYGDIVIKDINYNTLEINSNYGNVNLNNINSDNIVINTEDGNVNLNNIQVIDTLKINNKYGNIDLLKSNAENLIVYLEDGNVDISKISTNYSELKNKYGNIYAVDFTSKGLLVNCDDGDIDLRGNFFGNTDINNKYGNVNIISYQDEKFYNYSIVNKYGNINVNNEIFNSQVLKNNNGDNNLNITCEDGNIKTVLSK